MAEGNEHWSPLQFRKEERELEARLQQIEDGLLRARDLKRVLVDPATGEFVDETGVTPGGTGGGGGGGTAPHELLNDGFHPDTVTADPVSQDLIVANSSTPSKWQRFAVGTSGFSLQVVAGVVTWATRVHNLLSSIHGDVSAAACARGAVIVGNASALWARVTAGAAGTYLGSDGTDTAFRQVQHSQLGGVGANDHHNQSHVLATSAALGPDHTVSGLTTGHVLTATGATTAAFQAPATTTPTITVKEAGSAVDAAVTTLDLGAGFDVTSSPAGEANVALDLSEVVTGDLTFTGNAAAVTKLQGVAVTAPVAGNDGEALVYNHAGPNFEYAPISSGGATIVVQEGDSTVDAAAGTLDFAAGDFNVTSSPAGEANIAWQGFTVEEGNSSVATDIKTLDFGAGFDVSAAGGEADVNFDASEVLGGDVTYVGNAGELTAIQGEDLVIAGLAPGSVLQWVGGGTPQWENVGPSGGEQFLRSNAAATGLEFATLDTVLSDAATDPRIVEYTLWRRTDLSGVGALSEMLQFDGLTGGIVMPAAGKIIGLSMTASGDIGDAGDTYTLTVYKETTPGAGFSATAATITATGTAGTVKSASDLTFDIAFNQDDILTIYDEEGGTLNAVGAKATLYVKFNV